MNGSEVDSQLAQLQQQPFHVTEELLPALLGKLVKLVQENDIKTDADMDKTIDKAAGEVLEEAKAEPKEKTDSGDEAQKETIPHMVELETVKEKGVIKEVVESNESKIEDVVIINDDGNSVSGEVSKLLGQLPPSVQALTGVDLSGVRHFTL